MTVRSKYRRLFSLVCAAILVIAALSVGAGAVSTLSIPEIQEMMAANSAAWWVAHNAGDAATCAQLEEANEELAVLLAYRGGSAAFDTATGTWDIRTGSGTTIASSSGGSNGKTDSVSYTSTTADGQISMTTGTSYTDPAIDAYYRYGGTDTGLQTSYNNAADRVSTSGDYGDRVAVTSAEAEVAVAKKLLGLTDAQAAKLQAELELSKQAYEAAQTKYDAAVAAGDTEAAEAAMAKMNEAHDAAQESRAQFGYTGDSAEVNDGGYYYDDKPASGAWIVLTPVHTITAESGEGGSVSPSGTVRVAEGSDQSFTFTPEDGWELGRVLVDGAEAEAADGSYTFEHVTGPHTITAEFEKTGFTVTVTSGEGGSASPEGEIPVTYGEDLSIRFVPDEGWVSDCVLIDGINHGALEEWTFEDVKKDHTVKAVFRQADCVITAGAGRGGTISPAGAVRVTRGSDCRFTIVPDPGWEVTRVFVDGRDIGPVNGYTFRNVTEAHTIRAEFEASARIFVGTVSVTDASGVSLGGKSVKSGYGIFLRVPVTAENISDLQVTLTYDFGAGAKTVTLEKMGGAYVLPVNPASPTGARCVYIPVETKDGGYSLTVRASGRSGSGEIRENARSASVTVKGSMYEDDFTADS